MFLKKGNCKYPKRESFRFPLAGARVFDVGGVHVEEMHAAIPNTQRPYGKHRAQQLSIDGASDAQSDSGFSQ